jgi:phage FluMu gp28-like protein
LSRSLWRKIKSLEGKVEQLTRKPPNLPADPFEFCTKILRFEPTSYQRRLLESKAKQVLLRWARQTGKTTALACLCIIHASLHPGTATLIVAPGLRQSMILGERIRELLGRMPPEIRRAIVSQQMRTVFRFRNGSQITVLPNSENQLRGFTAHLIVIDEAAFFHNDEAIFRNILPPMLATTCGALIVSSTPWGKNTVFYQLNQDPDYEKHVVTWRDAAREGRYSEEFIKQLEKEREARPQVFKMEYEAEFIEEVDTWLSQDLLAKSCSEELEFLSFESQEKGRFHMGVDLAEHVDYSVIAVVRRDGSRLSLIHMHRFKKGTSLASVIGYAKILSERWRTIQAIYVDKTKHGDYIVEDMHEAGLRQAEGINFTQNTKQEMAQLMKQRMQEGILRTPYDRDLLDELNAERYELTKTGKIAFSHPEGTHDDRFWALALAVYADETASPPPSRPIARTT